VIFSDQLGPSGLPILKLKLSASAPSSRRSAASQKATPAASQEVSTDWRRESRDAQNWMMRRWPDSICRCLPLAVGCGAEIVSEAIAAGFSRRASRAALAGLTRRWRYLENVSAPGSVRVDLSGAPVEDVAEDHRRHAADLLNSRQVKMEK
jgi:hypothetical protein